MLIPYNKLPKSSMKFSMLALFNH